MNINNGRNRRCNSKELKDKNADNEKKINEQKMEMKIATLNVRSLKDNYKFLQLEKEFEHHNIDILGLAEVRRNGENIIKTKKENIWYYSDSDGHRGVGFLINKKYEKNIVKFMGVNDRIAMVEIELNNKVRIIVVQVHGPTLDSELKIIEKFYEALNKVIKEAEKEKNAKILIIGDFNSQIGKRENGEEKIMGPYNYGKRNKNGDMLISFCCENNLRIENTWFKKKSNRRWTWIAPNAVTKTQIDYILGKIGSKNIKNCEVNRFFNCDTDHRVIECKMMVNNDIRKRNRKWGSRKPDIVKNVGSYKKYIEENMDNINWESEDSDEINKQIIELLNVAEREIEEKSKKSTVKVNKKEECVNEKEGCKELYKRRRKILEMTKIRKKEKMELNQISKLIKIKRREYGMRKEEKMIEEILEENMAIKQIRKKLMLGNRWTSYLTEKNNVRVYDRKGINEVATRFYKKLYDDKIDEEMDTCIKDKKKQKGKVSYNEPQITKEELNSVINNLKNRRAPGMDRIRNEQIKYTGEKFKCRLLGFFNKIYKSGEIPKEWKIN